MPREGLIEAALGVDFGKLIKLTLGIFFQLLALAREVRLLGVAARDVKINVKVYVNPSGKVDFSELVSKVPDTDRDLAVLAVFAARRWEFSQTCPRRGQRSAG